MKHLFLIAGLSSLPLLASAQRKDLFDINNHLQKNKRKETLKSFSEIPALQGNSKYMLFQYRLSDETAVYSHPAYRMPVIVSEISPDQVPNPGLSQRLNTVILFLPTRPGYIPNPAPPISF